MRPAGLEIHLPHNNFKHYRTSSSGASSAASSSASPTPSTMSTSPTYPITFTRDDLPARSDETFPAYACYEHTLASYHNTKLRQLLDDAEQLRTASPTPPTTPSSLLPAFTSDLPSPVLVGGVLRLAPERSHNASTDTLVEEDVQRRVAVKIRPARTHSASDELALHTAVTHAEERPGFSSWLSGLFVSRGRSTKRSGSSRRR
ncbi:uncharacterized protein LOC62_02G002617 [Vanrija pseudolonga]|uniref:Uncharacterized protein n=1 Tax=Vanrija pseudolonga TaxID=143232 RepID=A0AAF0Y7E0_9TREE|nr:hypothetical protein LOC62_02G002617 [Vanrija pseudolonga]